MIKSSNNSKASTRAPGYPYPGRRVLKDSPPVCHAPCECGGGVRRGAAPRCPHCHLPLSADLATPYIEMNAPGTKKGSRWQKNWSGIYCIVIEDKRINNNF